MYMEPTPSQPINDSPQSIEFAQQEFAQQPFCATSPSQPLSHSTLHAAHLPNLPVSPQANQAVLPPLVYFSNPATGGRRVKQKGYKAAKGQIIVTPTSITKYNGRQWRRLCGVEDCWKESQKHGLCMKHLKSPAPPLIPIQRRFHVKSGTESNSKSATLDFEQYKRTLKALF